MTELEKNQMSQQIAESMALTAKLQTETSQLTKETIKLQAETFKINKENDWYVAITASTAHLQLLPSSNYSFEVK